MPPLKGKVAIVTGGASGIGWATCRLLADQGANVLVADLNEERAQIRAAELGDRHLGVGVDVASVESLDAMFSACVDRFGRLDILVNNAGRSDTRGLELLDHDRAGLDNLLAVNLLSVVNASRKAAALMHGGAIVNVASGAAFSALPLRGAYSASKAGVVALTEALAATFAGGIRVNAVAPGFVRTELVEGLIAAGRLNPDEAAAKIPMGRLGRPEEIAAAIAFLAEPASSRISGAVLSVDGGSQAFGGSRPPARVERPGEPRPDGGLTIVLGDGAAAQACMDDLKAIQRPAVNVANARQTLAKCMDELARSHDRVDAVIDATRYPQADLALAIAERFETAQIIGRFLREQGTGTFGLLADPADFIGVESATAGSEALGMLVKTMACEWAARNVTANAVIAPAGEGAAQMLSFLTSPAASYATGVAIKLSGKGID